MQNKLRRISKYILYFVGSNAIYGVIVYTVFTWLSGFSLLYAYLGNLTMIFLGLLMDEYNLRMLQSRKLVKKIKEVKDSEKNYRLIQRIMDSFVSFKTALYLFYIFILIFSQIIDFHQALVSENIRNFIRTNDYSILFLLAFDTLIARFVKDRERMKKISEEFEKSFVENQK